MKPNTSTRRWLARTTAPWIVALSAGVSPPAVRMPIRFMCFLPAVWGAPPRRPVPRTLYGALAGGRGRDPASFTMARIERPAESRSWLAPIAAEPDPGHEAQGARTQLATSGG